MTFHQKLEKNFQAGRYTIAQDKDGYYQIFSTKDDDGDFRTSGWRNTVEECKQYIGEDSRYYAEKLKEYSKNWKIVGTIHCTELMGEGYKVGDKVRIVESGILGT